MNKAFHMAIRRDKKMLDASITVEAAIVIPIFLYASMSLLYMLLVLNIKMTVNRALYNSIRTVSEYAYLCNGSSDMEDKDKSSLINEILDDVNDQDKASLLSDALGIGTIEALMLKELGSDYAKSNNIVGGNAGFNFFLSDVMTSSSLIDVKVNYRIKNPFDIWGFMTITVSERMTCDAWLGEDYAGFNNLSNTSVAGNDSEFVYITEKGTVYHTSRSCTYLTRNISNAPLSAIENLRNSSGAKYYPCERCKPKGNSTVYYTEYGDRYHSDINCSQLSRNIITVAKSQVGDRKECEKCAK